MAHQRQVSVLSHLHLRQAEEIRAQSDEIKRLSTLLENSKLFWSKSRRIKNNIESLWLREPSHLHPG